MLRTDFRRLSNARALAMSVYPDKEKKISTNTDPLSRSRLGHPIRTGELLDGSPDCVTHLVCHFTFPIDAIPQVFLFAMNKVQEVRLPLFDVGQP